MSNNLACSEKMCPFRAHPSFVMTLTQAIRDLFLPCPPPLSFTVRSLESAKLTSPEVIKVSVEVNTDAATTICVISILSPKSILQITKEKTVFYVIINLIVT